MMRLSQPDTASPDSGPGRISFTHGKKHDKISSSNKRSMTVYPRGKFATVEQLQLSVLKRRKKSQRLQTRSIAFNQWKKRLEHFLRTEEDTYFFNKLAMGNDLLVLFKATRK